MSGEKSYEALNKFSLYVAGVLFVTLMGYQASLQKDQIVITKELAKTNADQQVDIASIATSLEAVIGNQNNLREIVNDNHESIQSIVWDVERKLISICARSGACD